jgi:hypothetical protein
MAQERERWRAGGVALGRVGEGGKEEGERGRVAWLAGSAKEQRRKAKGGVWPGWPAQPTGPDRSTGPNGR